MEARSRSIPSIQKTLAPAVALAMLALGWLGSAAAQITEFPIPTSNSGPLGIALGPDGNLWFTESNVGKIGRITPTGTFNEFSTSSGTWHITAGPDAAAICLRSGSFNDRQNSVFAGSKAVTAKAVFNRISTHPVINVIGYKNGGRDMAPEQQHGPLPHVSRDS